MVFFSDLDSERKYKKHRGDDKDRKQKKKKKDKKKKVTDFFLNNSFCFNLFIYFIFDSF